MTTNSRSILTGRQDNTLRGIAYNTDGSIKTDLAHNTTGISIYVQRKGAADGSPLTLSAKATPATAHADGAFLNLGGGDISVDIPDAPVSGYLGEIRIYGTFTGGFVIGEWYDVVAYDAATVAVGANTVTPPTVSQITNNLLGVQVLEGVSYIDYLLGLPNSQTVYTQVESALTDYSLTDYITLVPQVVWEYSTRALSNFDFNVTVGTNNDKTGYTLTSDYDAAKTAAQPSDVSPTINFNPTINPTPVTVEPTPVTVNPTVLSSQSVTDIQTGLATTQNVTDATNTITTAIDNIELELSPENIEEISDAVSEAVGEGVIEQIEREGGVLSTILSKFLGIDLLAKWLRK